MAAVTGMVIAGVSAGMSFAQAGKQNKLQKEAQKDAEKALLEAKKQLEVNYFKQLGIQKEPYELQREAMLTQGAEGVQALQEAGSRAVAGGIGRIQMAQNEAQAGIRTAMGQEMSNIDKLVAQEDAALAQQRANINLAESEGAQKAAALAGQRAAQSLTQGMDSLTNLAGAVYKAQALYKKTKEPKQQSTYTAPPDITGSSSGPILTPTQKAQQQSQMTWSPWGNSTGQTTPNYDQWMAPSIGAQQQAAGQRLVQQTQNNPYLTPNFNPYGTKDMEPFDWTN